MIALVTIHIIELIYSELADFYAKYVARNICNIRLFAKILHIFENHNIQHLDTKWKRKNVIIHLKKAYICIFAKFQQITPYKNRLKANKRERKTRMTTSISSKGI